MTLQEGDAGAISELNAFGAGARFHHTGLVLKSIEAVSPGSETTFDPIQKVKIAFVSLNGAHLELLEPVGDDSPVKKGLESGARLVHLCFEVPDLAAAIEKGRAHGFHRIGGPVPAVVFDGREIAWVFSRTYGLVELLAAA